MSRCGSPRVSEDSIILRTRLEQTTNLELLSKQEYEDYKLKPLELAFKDLERDVSQFREKPRLLLSEIMHKTISDDPNKPLYLHLAFTAAFAPFSTIFCGPHQKDVVELDFSIWQLTQPPYCNYRIEKIMLLRLIMLNFWEYVVGDYFDVVEEIVRRKDRYFHGHDEDEQSNVNTEKSSLKEDISLKEESSLEEESSVKEKSSWKEKLKGLFKRKKRTLNWRQFDVTEVEHEARRFAQTELIHFLRLFNFIVKLRVPSVEYRLLRYLEPKEEDYVVDESGRWDFAKGISWKADKRRRKENQAEGEVNSWWTGTGLEVPD